jgi:hypothetical protein
LKCAICHERVDKIFVIIVGQDIDIDACEKCKTKVLAAIKAIETKCVGEKVNE